MVKSPKIQHSKAPGEPVTIDLPADDVKRVVTPPPPPSGAPASGPAAEGPVAPVTPATAVPAASTGSKTQPAGGSTAPGSEKPERTIPSSSSGPKIPAASELSPTDSIKAKVVETTAKDGVGSADAGTQKVADKAAAGTASASGSATGSRSERAGAAANASFGRDAGKSAPAPSDDAAPQRAPDANRGRGGGLIAAGLIGGVIALVGAAGAYYGGLLPRDTTVAGVAPDSAATDALRADLVALQERMQAMQANPAGTGTAPNPDLQARVEGLAVTVEDLRNAIGRQEQANGAAGPDGQALAERLAAIEQRVQALPADDDALAQLRQAADAAGVQAGKAQQVAEAAGSGLQDASRRLDAIEKTVAQISAQVAEQAKRPAVAQAIAASALKSAIDSGRSFAAELDTFAGVAPDAPEVADLRAMAATGVPTQAALSAEIDGAARAMVDAGRTIDPNAGVVDRLLASAQSLVSVRPVGQPTGSDVPSVVARIEAAIAGADYARATSEYETLPAASKAAGAAFMDKVRARMRADELAGRALAAALRA